MDDRQVQLMTERRWLLGKREAGKHRGYAFTC